MSRVRAILPSLSSLPNFFIAGAPKTGTTSLYHALDQHPQIYMSPVKEPCYFASEIRIENFSGEHQPRILRDMQAVREFLSGPMRETRFGGIVPDWESYLKLFQNTRGEKAVGEASVCYLWSSTAAANIASRIPQARIIMILRDPADRAFSQYLHTLSSGLVRHSFREHIQRAARSPGGKFGVLHPFLEFGLYYEQVKRYLELFPKENLRIYFYEEPRARMWEDLLAFLNADFIPLPDTSRRHTEPPVPRAIGASYLLKKLRLWQAARALTPRALRPRLKSLVFRQRRDLVMEPRDRQYLIRYYREDVLKLASLLDRDLGAWLR